MVASSWMPVSSIKVLSTGQPFALSPREVGTDFIKKVSTVRKAFLDVAVVERLDLAQPLAVDQRADDERLGLRQPSSLDEVVDHYLGRLIGEVQPPRSLALLSSPA